MTAIAERTADQGERPMPEASRRNPALWAMVVIPAATVIASILTLRVSFVGRDPELPAQYAWEGASLDRDLARAEQARRLGIGAALSLDPSGRIAVQLTGAPDAPQPATLELLLTHASRPALDRRITLAPAGAAGRYAGLSSPLPAGNWLLQLDGRDAGWRLRGRLQTASAGAAPARLRLGW